MAFTPISHTVTQYHNAGVPASGYVLKAYSSGTLTNISMATDSTGDTTAATITLNAQGYPAVSGTVIIPYINEKYKLALYATQAAADADTGAIWTVDTVPIGIDLGSVTQNLSSTTALTASDINNHIVVTGTVTLTMADVTNAVGSGYIITIRNAGTGIVTLDGTGAETINGGLTLVMRPGYSAMLISSSTATDDWSTVGFTEQVLTGLNDGYITNRYYYGGFGALSGTQAISDDTFYATPFWVGKKTTFTRIGLNVSSTGTAASARLGIYTFVDGLPIALVLDAGTVDVSGTGEKEATISQSLDQGLYFLAFVGDGTFTASKFTAQSTLVGNVVGQETVSGNNAGSVAVFTFAALPATTSSLSLGGGNSFAAMWLRKV